MDDGVLVLDAQRRIVDLNAAAERYTGCTVSSLGQPDRRSGGVVERRRRRRPAARRGPAGDRQGRTGTAVFRGQGVGGARLAAALRRLAGDHSRHLEPPPQRSGTIRVRAPRAGTAEEREPDGARRRRGARLQQPADRHSRQRRSAGDHVAAGVRPAPRRRGDRDRRAARRRSGVEDARLLRRRPRRGRTRRSRRAGQGDGGSAGARRWRGTAR